MGARTVRIGLSAVVAALLAACGGPEEAPPPDASGGMDAAPTCSADDDCDDGTFCNGAERCNPSGAGADARGCVAAPEGPCAAADLGCDEEADRCTSCAVEDADGDGRRAVACGGDDCDDDDPNRFPGNPEVCDAADHDEDCDPTTFGFRDVDGDDVPDAACCNVEDDGETRHCGTDCDDVRRTVNPTATEVCDSVDNDCNGEVDEGVTVVVYTDEDGDRFGVDGTGTAACDEGPGTSLAPGDCDDSNPSIHPGAMEVCDSVDNDCSGGVDDGLSCSCTGTSTQPCGSDVGACERGTQRCTGGTWGACEGEVSSRPELCNGVDDDCNGTPDDGAAVSSCAPLDHSIPSCIGGACRYACESGYADCTAAAGCETDVSSSVTHCGACGAACPTPANAASRACSEGSCVITACLAGYTNCDGEFANGCERNTTVDPGACGASCVVCPARANASRTCSSGTCGFTCNTGYRDCNGNPTDGCEAQTASDPMRCGDTCMPCPVPSNGSASCVLGMCRLSCNAGYVPMGTTCARIEPPRLLFPLHDAQVLTRTPTFRWANGANATGARIEICSDRACATVVQTLRSPLGSGTSVTATALAPGHYWTRVVGTNGASDGTTVGVGRRFVITTTRTGSGGAGLQFLNVNFDRHDLAAGAPLAGRVAYFAGQPAGGLAATPTETLTAPAPGANGFGMSVAPAGDVDGDGRGDLVVGACRATGPASAPPSSICANAEFVFYGHPLREGFGDGTAGSRAPTRLDAPAGIAGFGYSVASAGDWDGDGWADVVVGAFYSNRAYVYFGSATGADPTRVMEISVGGGVGNAGGLFGLSVGNAGDFNADGFSDVVVGQPIRVSGGTGGRAWVFLGRAIRSVSGSYFFEMPMDGTNTGISVAGAGDVDADGFADIVVGGNGQYGGTTGAGVVVVVRGRAGSGQVSSIESYASIGGGTMGAGRGTSVFGVGDTNGDGRDDVLAGAPGEQRFYVFRGATTTFPTTPAWNVHVARAEFGRWVGGVGLLSGTDLRTDFVVGACEVEGVCSHEAYVYYGETGAAPTLHRTWAGMQGTGAGVLR